MTLTPILTVLKAAVLSALCGLLIDGVWGGSLFTLHGGSQRLYCGLCVCVKAKEGA